ncbi:hypothetical protein FKM82_007987 [Ascaphus truei]
MAMMELKAIKIRVTFCIILFGVSLMLAAVMSDHWAVLSPKVDDFNQTCEVAHFGLWRLCTKKIFIREADSKNKGCGPLSLPGDHSCSYFKHFTSGENAEIFEVTTQKGICIMISAEVIRQSVQRMIDSKDTLWIEYYYSWSFACACSAFALLFLCGIALLLISLPRMPRNPWETCMDAEPDI